MSFWKTIKETEFPILRSKLSSLLENNRFHREVRNVNNDNDNNNNNNNNIIVFDDRTIEDVFNWMGITRKLNDNGPTYYSSRHYGSGVHDRIRLNANKGIIESAMKNDEKNGNGTTDNINGSNVDVNENSAAVNAPENDNINGSNVDVNENSDTNIVTGDNNSN